MLDYAFLTLFEGIFTFLQGMSTLFEEVLTFLQGM